MQQYVSCINNSYALESENQNRKPHLILNFTFVYNVRSAVIASLLTSTPLEEGFEVLSHARCFAFTLFLFCQYVTPKARKNFGQMTDAQKKQLDSIGFEFELPEELRAQDPIDWAGAYDALIQYHKNHGDCNVPQATSAVLADGTEIKLGKWVQRQRQVYKNTVSVSNHCVFQEEEKRATFIFGIH